MVNHLSKYRSLMPSLALLFQLVNPEPWGPDWPLHTQVSMTAAQLAVAWCEYLEAHARRVYQSVTRRTQSGAARRISQHPVTHARTAPTCSRTRGRAPTGSSRTTGPTGESSKSPGPGRSFRPRPLANID